jgi:regulator of protease activity HflC (stomatin/prohibitin superfamily)
VEVAVAFHAEFKALEDSEARRLEGREYAARVRPQALEKARAIRERARTSAVQRTLAATGDAARFGAALALDRAAPRIFRPLTVARAIEQVLALPRRRFVVPPGATQGILDLDLGDKLMQDDIGIESNGTEKR